MEGTISSEHNVIERLKHYQDKKPESSFFYLQVFILGLLIVFMFMVETPLKWVIGLTLLAIVSIDIFYVLSYNTKNIPLWRRENELDDVVHLKVSRISDIVERAFKGRELSQAFLEEKIKTEFLNKLKEKRNLSNEEVKYLLDHPEEMREVVGDDELTDFIYHSRSFKGSVVERGGESYDSVNIGDITSKKSYRNKIIKILKKMEDWN